MAGQGPGCLFVFRDCPKHTGAPQDGLAKKPYDEMGVSVPHFLVEKQTRGGSELKVTQPGPSWTPGCCPPIAEPASLCVPFQRPPWAENRTRHGEATGSPADSPSPPGQGTSGKRHLARCGLQLSPGKWGEGSTPPPLRGSYCARNELILTHCTDGGNEGTGGVRQGCILIRLAFSGYEKGLPALSSQSWVLAL